MAANQKKAEAKASRKVTLEFVPDSVTKNTVIFAECTATGTVKELKESLVGRIYVKQNCAAGFEEQGIALSEPDEDDNQYLDTNKIRVTLEFME